MAKLVNSKSPLNKMPLWTRFPVRLPTHYRAALPSVSTPRYFRSSLPVLARRAKAEERLTPDQAMDLLDDEFDDDDTASAGHIMLRSQRQVLYYLRLIEHEMPKLVAYRIPFIPPTLSAPMIVRSIDYAGEEHPATIKRVVVVSVDHLPLRDASAIHKIKILAGPRWTPNPPADAGVSGLQVWGNGFIKIACEDFPKSAMNLKWASDTLDRLIMEANDKNDKFRKVPLDMRHVYAKARKGKKGDHLRNRIFGRPSIMDFPDEWLPKGATTEPTDTMRLAEPVEPARVLDDEK